MTERSERDRARPAAEPVPAASSSLVGVVVNPNKVADLAELRAAVDARVRSATGGPALWRETTEDDAGVRQTRELLAAGVDLVLSCGGDGTVRACAEALCGTGVPLGVLAAGTGNLLARNLDIPMDRLAALEVALAGRRRQIDLGHSNGEPFAVMTGLGIDAAMVGEAPERLKGRIGWLAYAISGLRAVRGAPTLRVRLELDGREPIERRGVGVLVANVGTLTGGLLLLPEADPGDGQLDVAVLRPSGWREWGALALRVLTRGDQRRPHVDTWKCTSVRVQVDRAVAAEVDGDVRPETRELEVTVAARELTVCVP